ncbi:SpoIIE family protein phosphatase [Streptomyces somaliensis DSM 40738]|uniref:protein-serine/threonine phosphatase n=1 Tax=Streptomyces somaliensis (strain ATCC 33201 / DSM 40738 / JCM 12659 / KCTC 9044 / NCTC 11332 / NRRL B-12077 / IP 733) TaxID=1134445 RepID=A0AA44DDI6_STRE0|nr:SpoIIE family protein phosphatase [Streptomyces somaliensis]MCQ0024811.1 SpoIIE family protein phosphatase [Streptomyces somaliensis DSM 40738]NKY14186.1 SpoIIE family protein phosphatase [Streptomyces somaliensis DSM 40738]
MRTEELLAAILTGLWRWDHTVGLVELDAEAARLLGLPAEPVAVAEGVVRSRVHPVDWNEFGAVASLALAEDTLAEARLRVMDEKGQVVRMVRSRAKPMSDGTGLRFVGTLQQVAEPDPGSAAHTPVTGDWRRSREAFLLDAGRALAEARSTAEVLRVAASLSMPGFSPNGLAVFKVTGDRLTVIGQHGYEPDDEDLFSEVPLDSDDPAAEVVRTGRAVYVSSQEEYRERFPSTWPLARRLGRGSWAFLPLVVAGRTMGAWMASFAHQVGFTPDERSVLTTVARMLAQALTRAGAAESERELSLGLQRTMMPVLGPAIPGMEVAARYVPTGGGLQVGGDWYDMIQLPAGRSAFVIGDVQGHDVRAAGLMGQLRIALRAYAAEGHRPDAVLSRASRFLHGITEEGGGDADGARFATCLYVEVDPATGTLDIARAGHPDPAVLMPDGTVVIRPTDGGLPLGIVPDTDYPTTRMTLEPGETMMICTDGLLETGGHDMETGWLRVRRLLEDHDPHRDSLETLADSLVQAVHGPGSHYTTGPLADRREDDIAVLLLSRKGGPAGRPVPPRRTALAVAQAEPERISTARRQVRELLHDWADGEQVDSAALMVSEMVTNVLLHTDGDARLVAEVRGEHGRRRLRVEVADSSDELPHRRRPGEMASSGRGLMLMEGLADAWGVDPRGEGKSIWFELYEDGAPTAGP